MSRATRQEAQSLAEFKRTLLRVKSTPVVHKEPEPEPTVVNESQSNNGSAHADTDVVMEEEESDGEPEFEPIENGDDDSDDDKPLVIPTRQPATESGKTGKKRKREDAPKERRSTGGKTVRRNGEGAGKRPAKVPRHAVKKSLATKAARRDAIKTTTGGKKPRRAGEDAVFRREQIAHLTAREPVDILRGSHAGMQRMIRNILYDCSSGDVDRIQGVAIEILEKAAIHHLDDIFRNTAAALVMSKRKTLDTDHLRGTLRIMGIKAPASAPTDAEEKDFAFQCAVARKSSSTHKATAGYSYGGKR